MQRAAVLDQLQTGHALEGEKSEPSISDASPDPDDDIDAKSIKANDQRDPDTRLAAAETANAEMRAKMAALEQQLLKKCSLKMLDNLL